MSPFIFIQTHSIKGSELIQNVVILSHNFIQQTLKLLHIRNQQ